MVILKKTLMVSLWFLVLMGCAHKAEEVNINTNNSQIKEQIESVKAEFKKEILELESKLADQDREIQNLKDKLESNKQWTVNSYRVLDDNIRMVNQMVSYLPDVTQQQGYIKEVIEEDSEIYFVIDFAKMLSDKNAPNNFTIENKEKKFVKVRAVPDVGTFILEGVYHNTSPLDKFKTDIKEYDRFFNLYFVQGKLVLVTEQYLP